MGTSPSAGCKLYVLGLAFDTLVTFLRESEREQRRPGAGSPHFVNHLVKARRHVPQVVGQLRGLASNLRPETSNGGCSEKAQAMSWKVRSIDALEAQNKCNREPGGCSCVSLVFCFRGCMGV